MLWKDRETEVWGESQHMLRDSCRTCHGAGEIVRNYIYDKYVIGDQLGRTIHARCDDCDGSGLGIISRLSRNQTGG